MKAVSGSVVGHSLA